MWIKICGTTNLADAQLAVEAGADALGFVFAASPRRMTAAQVAEITRALPKAIELPGSVETIGVFADAGFDEIVTAVHEGGLTGVQLHSDVDLVPDLAMRLREEFSHGAPHSERLTILQVLHFHSEGDALQEQLAELGQNPALDAVLVDSRTPQARGGTGICFDWQAASRGFLSAARQLRVIAAGGLKPENVREAIETLRPWGVDVASGVEAAPGRKDPARVKEFIATARAAAMALEPAAKA
jgi:phosphoribosylanthranilate isomerase